jgi:hypothetical protein
MELSGAGRALLVRILRSSESRYQRAILVHGEEAPVQKMRKKKMRSAFTGRIGHRSSSLFDG